MAVAGATWQLECETVEQRCGYLLTSGLWSDCTFVVGSGTTHTVLAHKLVLAMASHVFEAIFYGGLSERNEPIVIPDVEPEVFRTLLQYIYTGNIDIGSFDIACDLLYCAKKYVLPHLVKKCKGYICTVAGPSNSCRVQELARIFDEKMVTDKGVQDTAKAVNIVHGTRPNVQQALDKGIPEAQGPAVPSGNDKSPSESRSGEPSTSRSDIPPRVNRAPSSAPALSGAGLYEKYSPRNYVPLTQRLQLQNDAAKAVNIVHGTRPNVQQALDKGIPEAQGPAVSSENDKTPSESRSGEPSPSRSDIPPRVKRPLSSAPAMSGAGLCEEYLPRNYAQQQNAVVAAREILYGPDRIQAALDKGILDALVPALTEGDDKCKLQAVIATHNLCRQGSPSQLAVLAASATLEPYCRLLTARGKTCYFVLRGLTDLLMNVEKNTRPDLLLKLREIGVPQLLIPLQQHSDVRYRDLANYIRETYFGNGQY